MRKLKLELEELIVESFEPSETRGRRGTVMGNETEVATCLTCDVNCGAGSGCQTCKVWNTCEGDHTCNFADGCYTWNGGFTCVRPCTPTQQASCTSP